MQLWENVWKHQMTCLAGGENFWGSQQLNFFILHLIKPQQTTDIHVLFMIEHRFVSNLLMKVYINKNFCFCNALIFSFQYSQTSKFLICRPFCTFTYRTVINLMILHLVNKNSSLQRWCWRCCYEIKGWKKWTLFNSCSLIKWSNISNFYSTLEKYWEATLKEFPVKSAVEKQRNMKEELNSDKN